MTIIVNGEAMPLDSPLSIQEWLQSKGLNPALIAIEYNGKLITRETYTDITLKEGEKLEVVRFVGGG